MPWQLDWTTTDANSVDIDNGVGSGLPANGSAIVNPIITTTYTLTAYGYGGTDIAQVVVVVGRGSFTDEPTVCHDDSLDLTVLRISEP